MIIDSQFLDPTNLEKFREQAVAMLNKGYVFVTSGLFV